MGWDSGKVLEFPMLSLIYFLGEKTTETRRVVGLLVVGRTAFTDSLWTVWRVLVCWIGREKPGAGCTLRYSCFELLQA